LVRLWDDNDLPDGVLRSGPLWHLL